MFTVILSGKRFLNLIEWSYKMKTFLSGVFVVFSVVNLFFSQYSFAEKVVKWPKSRTRPAVVSKEAVEFIEKLQKQVKGINECSWTTNEGKEV